MSQEVLNDRIRVASGILSALNGLCERVVWGSTGRNGAVEHGAIDGGDLASMLDRAAQGGRSRGLKVVQVHGVNGNLASPAYTMTTEALAAHDDEPRVITLGGWQRSMETVIAQVDRLVNTSNDSTRVAHSCVEKSFELLDDASELMSSLHERAKAQASIKTRDEIAEDGRVRLEVVKMRLDFAARSLDRNLPFFFEQFGGIMRHLENNLFRPDVGAAQIAELIAVSPSGARAFILRLGRDAVWAGLDSDGAEPPEWLRGWLGARPSSPAD